MAISREQEKNLDIVIDSFNDQLEIMKKGIGNGRGRIESLMRSGFHIERMMVNAQLVEHAVKQVLFVCRLKREVANILEIVDPYANVGRDKNEQEWFEEVFKNFSRKSLGIVTRLLRMITKDDNLANKIEEFNTYRQEFIHQVFNGMREMEEIDKEADDYLSNKKDLAEIVIPLAYLQKRVRGEVNEIIQQV